MMFFCESPATKSWNINLVRCAVVDKSKERKTERLFWEKKERFLNLVFIHLMGEWELEGNHVPHVYL